MLIRRSGGYLLDVDPKQVDVHRFRRLTAQARSATGHAAAGMLDEARALWRGSPFSGATSVWLERQREALAGERLDEIVR